MERQKTFYSIYSAQDMDKELLLNWRIPTSDDQTLIEKEQVMASIYTEIETKNYTGAIDILKKYFKNSNIELPKELYDLELNIKSQQSSTEKIYRNEYIGNMLKETSMYLIRKFIDNGDFKDEQNFDRF